MTLLTDFKLRRPVHPTLFKMKIKPQGQRNSIKEYYLHKKFLHNENITF